MNTTEIKTLTARINARTEEFFRGLNVRPMHCTATLSADRKGVNVYAEVTEAEVQILRASVKGLDLVKDFTVFPPDADIDGHGVTLVLAQ